MTNTLPDLRLTIAEGMTALAHAKADHWQPYMEAELMRPYNGAQTLRWCAAREAPSIEDLQAEVDSLTLALEEAEDNVGDLVDNVKHAVATWKHAKACPKDPCQCDLEARRRSALAAVA